MTLSQADSPPNKSSTRFGACASIDALFLGAFAMTPLRPNSITAAAVLLIVMGSELILLGVGLLALIVSLSVKSIAGCCCYVTTVGFVGLIGGSFLRSGIGLLRGKELDTRSATHVVVFVGVIALLISLSSMICCGWVVFIESSEWIKTLSQDREVVSLLLVIWSNTAALVATALFLRSGAAEYLRYREQLAKPKSELEYESDDEM